MVRIKEGKLPIEETNGRHIILLSLLLRPFLVATPTIAPGKVANSGEFYFSRDRPKWIARLRRIQGSITRTIDLAIIEVGLYVD